MKYVEGYIQRKSMLYKTGVEYGDYTMNHVQGCSHGCKYPCYAFMMKKRFGLVKNYEDWIKPFLVSNTLELLNKEIPRLKSKIKSVQLCFSTDPFMVGYEEVEKMSLAAIHRLNESSIKCIILTKGILPEKLTEFSKLNEYGITLVSIDEKFRKNYEPYSAIYKDRISALKKLHDAGCYTWVSIEPYPTPNICDQDLLGVLETIKFVDKIVFGRLNYNKTVSSYNGFKDFYNKEADLVTKFCENNQIELYIKKGTVS